MEGIRARARRGVAGKSLAVTGAGGGKEGKSPAGGRHTPSRVRPVARSERYVAICSNQVNTLFFESLLSTVYSTAVRTFSRMR